MNQTWNNQSGQFCWIEMMTKDGAGFKEFYGKLFGWNIAEEAMSSGGSYMMFNLKADQPLGGAFQMNADMLKQNIPTHWNAYITVENVDATVTKVAGLGGKVVQAPFDVVDAGRMAVLEDPSGAIVSVWQGKQHAGFGPFVCGTPGTPAWFELATKDVEKCGKFYCQLFGWNAEAKDMGGFTYTTFSLGADCKVAGMMQMTKEWGDAPSHWMTYFNTSNCDALAKQIADCGGSICVPPTEVPGVCRFLVANDPQGGFFSAMTWKQS